MGMTETSETFTEAQATDEMVLLFTRKMRRMHPEAFADVWSKLPVGAQRAVCDAERRADMLRDSDVEYMWVEPKSDDDLTED